MARVVITEITCDVCSSPVKDGADTHLGVADVWYTVDLCDEHRDEVFNFLDRFMVVGSIIRPEKKTISTSPGKGKSQKSQDLDKIRDWARSQGMAVSDRGRVAQGIIDAYNQAHTPTVGSQGDHEPPEPAAPAEPDNATLISLSDVQGSSDDFEGDDMMPGTSASLDAPSSEPKDVSPVKGKKTPAKVAGVRNPDGTPAGE